MVLAATWNGVDFAETEIRPFFFFFFLLKKKEKCGRGRGILLL
jgi:hypothetical protein